MIEPEIHHERQGRPISKGAVDMETNLVTGADSTYLSISKLEALTIWYEEYSVSHGDEMVHL